MSEMEDGCAHCGRPTGAEVFACEECRGAHICRTCAKETGLLGLTAAWEDLQYRRKAASVKATKRAQNWQTFQSAMKKGGDVGSVLKLLVGGK